MSWLSRMMGRLLEPTPKTEYHDLTLIPMLKKDKGRLLLSFKAGTTRLYVIRNLTEFVKCYARKRVIILGTKTELDFGVHRISSSSQALFEFMHQIVCEEMDKPVPVQKYIELSGKRLEQFNEMYVKQPAFSFYLDAEDGKIRCKAEVTYGTNKHSLLDNLREDLNYEVFRDYKQEEKTLLEVLKLFPEVDFDRDEVVCEESEETMEELLDGGMERLRELGEVHVTDRFRDIKVHKSKKMKMGISIKGNLLELDVTGEDIEGEEWLNILKSYQPKKKYYRLTNGEYAVVEQEDMETLLKMLEEMDVSLKEFVDGKMHLPVYRALYLDKMVEENENIKTQQDDNFKHLVQELKTPEESYYEVPPSLASIMRNYQVEGFRWMKALVHYGLGGILADDMGLGKTLQTIALLLSEKERGALGTALLIVPASLVYNWKAEFTRFAPDMKVSIVAGNAKYRAQVIRKYKESDVLVTSYDLAKRDLAEYENAEFSYQILDEAQYIKNHNTATAKSVKLIKSNHRLALTGTPIENRLSELWSIFDYLMPGFLYKYETFRSKWERAIVKEQDEEKSRQLKKMVSPFILRRKKEDVLKELPEKLEEICYVELEKEQQKIYDARVMELRNSLEEKEEEDLQKEGIAILAALTRLRQTCCGPELLYENYKGTSSKRQACMELVKRAVDGEHKMLIFSQFTSMLELLEEDLKQENIAYYKIIGATPKAKRLELVNAFNNDDTPVFLISLKAGGTGLNLTGADVVIHYDPWWNQAVTNQATDRAHRFGQTRPVTVYKLIAKNTIEEKILKLQERKKELAEVILSGESRGIMQMSKKELMQLLSR